MPTYPGKKHTNYYVSQLNAFAFKWVKGISLHLQVLGINSQKYKYFKKNTSILISNILNNVQINKLRHGAEEIPMCVRIRKKSYAISYGFLF